MALRRNDARRRRLVIDPTAQLGDVGVEVAVSPLAPISSSSAAQSNARTYSYGADRRSQRKTTDLIPKRAVAYMFVVLALLTCLWLINFTSVRAHQWAGSIGQAGMDVLAIRGQGSLAGWFASFLLIMTGLASLQIYALRQHRCDDYRGVYRMWLWIAGLLIIASISCVANLGAVAANLVQSMMSDSFVARSWVPLALKLTALSVLMARGIYEVRESRGSLALVIFVWVAYSVAAVLQLPAAKESLVGLGCDTMIGNCVLFGTAALFLAHLTYARYIFLDAHGLIAQQVNNEKASERIAVAEPKATKQQKTATTNPTVTTKSKTRSIAEVAETTGAKFSEGKQSRKTRKSKSAAANTTVDPQTANTAPSTSDVLKELAAASRAKEQSKRHASTQLSPSHFDQDDDTIKMSKSQRRKQRKLEKQRRRAA